MKVTAAVIRDGSGRYELEYVELRSPGADEILVRIVGAGMCHTDALVRVSDFPASRPIVTGHEGAGVVEAVGENVDGIVVGDHVVLSYASCGECQQCCAGKPAYCALFVALNLLGRDADGSTGMTTADGMEVSSRWFGQSSFATHAVVKARNAIVVDRSLTLEKLGPLACGMLTGAGSILLELDVQAGSSVVVFGAGSVGLAAVMAAKIAGAARIIAVDLVRPRLDLALELGATDVMDGAVDGTVERIVELTGGGADYAFDTTAAPAVVNNALASLRVGGACGLVGVTLDPIPIQIDALVGKTMTFIVEGGADPHELIPRLIGHWQAGEFPFDRLIETFPLSDINEAEQAAQRGDVVKPVLLPTG